MRYLLAALLVAAPLAGAAHADGFIVISQRVPDQPRVRNVPLSVKYHRVTVTVNGRVAVTEVDQVFVNPNPRRLEGQYLFPLPKGATIDRFSICQAITDLAKPVLWNTVRHEPGSQGIIRTDRSPRQRHIGTNMIGKLR